MTTVLPSVNVKLEDVNGPTGSQGPAPVEAPARHRLRLLLSTDPLQRRRLEQAGLAMGLLAAGVIGMHYFVWSGVAPARPVWWWSAGTLCGMVLFFVLIRSGVSARFAEPSLTVPQMVFALTSAAIAYALLGAGRGAVFPVVMVILMFGMFVATPSQMRWVSVYAVLLFGATMALSAAFRPGVYPPRIELGHFLLVATMMPAASLAGGAAVADAGAFAPAAAGELAQALARLRENTTRDELTGLVNRRHMLNLIEGRSTSAASVRGRPSAWRCWTWTASSRSTRRMAMRSATRCCARWRRKRCGTSAHRTRSAAGAARSSC